MLNLMRYEGKMKGRWLLKEVEKLGLEKIGNFMRWDKKGDVGGEGRRKELIICIKRNVEEKGKGKRK